MFLKYDYHKLFRVPKHQRFRLINLKGISLENVISCRLFFEKRSTVRMQISFIFVPVHCFCWVFLKKVCFLRNLSQPEKIWPGFSTSSMFVGTRHVDQILGSLMFPRSSNGFFVFPIRKRKKIRGLFLFFWTQLVYYDR